MDNSYYIRFALRKVFLPFFLFSILFIVGYSAFFWVVINTNWINVNVVVAEFILPLIIAAFFSYLIIRYRLKILSVKQKSRDGYTLLACIFLCAPVIIAQFYIKYATETFITVQNPSFIPIDKKNVSYEIKNYRIKKNDWGGFRNKEYLGKHKDRMILKTFFACPLIDSSGSNAHYKIWVGVNYSETINTSFGVITDADKELRDGIYEKQLDDFNNESFNDIKYFKRLDKDYDWECYREAIKYANKPLKTNEIVILLPETIPYHPYRGYIHFWAIGVWLIVNFIWLLISIFPKVIVERAERFEKEKTTLFTLVSNLKKDFKYFIPRENYFATPILLNMNILVFLLMLLYGVNPFNSATGDLILWGANNKNLVSSGQVWRLITYQFVHKDIMHLFMNTVTFMIGAGYLESIIGSKKLFFLYLIGGVVAGIVSILWNGNIVSVGASASVYAIWGTTLTLSFTSMTDEDEGFAYFAIFVICFGLGFVLSFAMESIDNAGHVSGLFSGIIIGLIIFYTRDKSKDKRKPKTIIR